MKPCGACPKRPQCRVPRDMARFAHVAHMLEKDDRNILLQRRLHHYVDQECCLVEAGVVDL